MCVQAVDLDQYSFAMAQGKQVAKLKTLRHYVETLCGIYSRIARRLGVDRTYVRRVAKGERHSPSVEAALIQEFDRSRERIGDEK
jgi:transcriptional regulator with XRE-family HTH domain